MTQREPVTVVIPVGPQKSHREWLDAAVTSVLSQASDDDRVLLVYDGPPAFPVHQLPPPTYKTRPDSAKVHSYFVPWRVGVGAAFNIGFGFDAVIPGWSNGSDLVLMLGSDDLLLPGAIDACVAQWETNDRADAYYWMCIEYGDDRKEKIQTVPCNAAMSTRGFWTLTGGFHPESGSGAPDAALISTIMVHAPAKLVPVYSVPRRKYIPLQWIRCHPGQDTATRGPWQKVILDTRQILTEQGFNQ